MRHAPPADAPIASGRFERVLIALGYALALGAGIQALLAALLGVDLPALGLLLVAGSAAVVGAWSWRPVAGHVRWDGQQWQWLATASPTGPGHALSDLRVQIDLGAWILLRWRVAGARRHTWACLHRGDAGRRWHGMRVALLAWSRQADRPQAGSPQSGPAA